MNPAQVNRPQVHGCGLKADIDLDLNPEQLAPLLVKGQTFIDVRAPMEFKEGHLPGAINLPLLNDEERHRVGLTYKQNGQEAAVKLGHQLIAGPVKEARLNAWRELVASQPEAIFYCFRGGMRSQISRQWLADVGLKQRLVRGGYKASRQFLLETLTQILVRRDFVMVAGPTGSGKTEWIQDAAEFAATLDLEKMAHHRGSAFGGYLEPQPSQANFENELVVALLKTEQSRGQILVEDESRMIGRIALPQMMYEKILSSPVVWLDEPREVRAQNICREYVMNAPGDERFGPLQRAVEAISKRLGGLRTQEVLADLKLANEEFKLNGTFESNPVWIAKLLEYYYDPLYLGSLDRRKVQVLFKGRRDACLDFLRNLTSP